MVLDPFIAVERRIQKQLDAGTAEMINLKEDILLLRAALAANKVQFEKLMELYSNIEAFLRIASFFER